MFAHIFRKHNNSCAPKNERNDKMEKSVENYKAEYKIITVKTTDGSTIYGKINIGEKERISDIFTGNKSLFVVMVDVSYKENVGKTMFINKRHIVWVEPEELT